MTIDNKSGKKYENAKLKLIAGDVNTINNYPIVMYDAVAAPKLAMSAKANGTP